MSKAVIIPTGDEIREGIVLDTDSAAVMTALLSLDPCMEIHRLAPAADEEAAILETLRSQYKKGVDYIILTGGSGGGHRCSPTLGRDYTHTALETFLDEKNTAEIYGKNGHLWCRLILGRRRNTVIFNLPGPYREAEAAVRAFAEGSRKGLPDAAVLADMQQAVLRLYGEHQDVEDLL